MHHRITVRKERESKNEIAGFGGLKPQIPAISNAVVSEKQTPAHSLRGLFTDDYLTQVPLDLPEQQLLAVLRREHDVVLALPGRVIKMIVLCFHHGLLEGSWRFPKETP